MWATICRKPLLFILLSAFCLRAAAAVSLQLVLDHTWKRTYLIEGDAENYWELGRKLAAGEDYAVYDPPRQVLRMPGFPAVLALSIAIAGESFLFARLLLAGVGTVGCWLVYALGKELFDRKTGLIAAGISAVLPTFVGFSVVILSETLFAVSLLACLLFMAKLTATGFAPESRQRGIRLSVAVGLMIAVACYVRPSWLPAGPLFGLLYLFQADNKKQALLRGGLVLAALYLALLPWAVRNKQVSGHWVFTTLWAGPSLYDALNPQADGSSDMTFFERDRLRDRGMTEYEVDRHYRQKARKFVMDNPGRTLELAFIKLGRFWKPWPNADQFRNVGYRLIVVLSFLPVFVPAAVGFWTHRHQNCVWLLTLGPVLYFSAIHMIFVGSIRYRLPAEYPLCVLSAAGIQCLLQRRKNHFQDQSNH